MKNNRGKILRIIVYGCLLLLIGATLVSSYLFLYFKPSPIEMNLSGSSLEMGEQYGGKLKYYIRLISSLYLKDGLCGGNEKLYEVRCKKAIEITNDMPVEYRDEIKKMSESSGVEYGALAYGNCFIDMGNAAPGCRSVVLTGKDNLFHSHNLDWDNIAGFGKWATCIVRIAPSDGRYKTVSIGFPGLIGAFDIINEHGIALSFNQAGYGDGTCLEPVSILLRHIAERSDSYDSAKNMVMHYSGGTPFIITLSDAISGKAGIFEKGKGASSNIFERQIKDAWLAAGNSRQGEIIGNTELDKVAIEQVAGNSLDPKKILSNSNVMMSCNIYSVIFNFKDNKFLLASGTVPAASGEYREFELFKK